MTCGQHPDDCLITCYLPHIVDARPAKKAGSKRGRCPACRKDALSLAPGRSARIVFWCFNHCPQPTVRAALLEAGVPPGCLPRISPAKDPEHDDAASTPRDSVARAELQPLLDLHGAALTLRLACLAWDVPPAEAAERLKMPERTYRRAVTARPNLAENRRSE